MSRIFKKIKKGIGVIYSFLKHKIELIILLLDWLFFSKRIIKESVKTLGTIKTIRPLGFRKWHNGTSVFFAEMEDGKKLFVKKSFDKESVLAESAVLNVLKEKCNTYGYKVCNLLLAHYENNCFFVIEGYVSAKPLSDVDFINGLSFERKCEIVTKVTKIVDSFYDNDIIHSDLTDKNILISDENEVYVIDFEYSIYNERDVHEISKRVHNRMLRLGGRYGMGNGLIDDSYTALLLCKRIIPELQVELPGIWRVLNKNIGRFQFDINSQSVFKGENGFS